MHGVAVNTAWLDGLAVFFHEASSCWWSLHFCQYEYVSFDLS
jgi:hypothetical protein